MASARAGEQSTPWLVLKSSGKGGFPLLNGIPRKGGGSGWKRTLRPGGFERNGSGLDFGLPPGVDPTDSGGAQHRTPIIQLADPESRLVVSTSGRTAS